MFARGLWAFALAAASVVVTAIGPAGAAVYGLDLNTPWVIDDPVFAKGDSASFGGDSGTSGYVFVEFQVATLSSLTVAAGQENPLAPDLDFTSISLVSDGPMDVSYVDIYGEDRSTPYFLPFDLFAAQFANLAPSYIYRLEMYFTGRDVISGSLSFDSLSHMPIPPAIALFGSGLVGLGLLSRRRKRTTSTRDE